jgi:SAM-dependent methyltransferase
VSKGEPVSEAAARAALEKWREEPYPSGAAYAALYANYDPAQGQDADASSRRLLGLCGPLRGKRLLDIGSGIGGLAILAAKDGAMALALEPQESMLDKAALAAAGVEWRSQRVEAFCREWTGPRFDAVCARQSVNYFARTLDWGALAALMPPGAVFAFNTFETPADAPEFGGRRWVGEDGRERLDVRRLKGGKIWHVQRAGDEEHCTAFDAIASEEFAAMLAPWFDAEPIREGASRYWRAKRRAD